MEQIKDFNNKTSGVNKLKDFSKIKKISDLEFSKLNSYIDKINNVDKYCDDIDISDPELLMDMVDNYANIIKSNIEASCCDDVNNLDETINMYVNAVATFNQCKKKLDELKMQVEYLD